MIFKEFLRKILSPKLFYKLVEIKNFFVPNESYKKSKISFSQSLKFYNYFISPGDIVFDIGANYGNRVQTFVALEAVVIAVEPQEKCTRFLKSIYGKNATILQKGVGSDAGTMNFYISDNSALSTFSLDWIREVKKTKRFGQSNWSKPVPIEVTTLNDLILKYGEPKFIKVDVEGMELKVLQGLDTAVTSLSFEYAVPENLSGLKECLMQMQTLGNYLVNFSEGETMELFFEQWISITDFLEQLSTEKFLMTSAGDIYLRIFK